MKNKVRTFWRLICFLEGIFFAYLYELGNDLSCGAVVWRLYRRIRIWTVDHPCAPVNVLSMKTRRESFYHKIYIKLHCLDHYYSMHRCRRMLNCHHRQWRRPLRLRPLQRPQIQFPSNHRAVRGDRVVTAFVKNVLRVGNLSNAINDLFHDISMFPTNAIKCDGLICFDVETTHRNTCIDRFEGQHFRRCYVYRVDLVVHLTHPVTKQKSTSTSFLFMFQGCFVYYYFF